MARNLFPLLLVLTILLAGAARGQESLVPIDETGRLDRIDVRLEQRLQLFPDYPEFREARLFRLADSSFVLEIEYGPEGRLSRVRLPMTASDVESLRRKVTETVAARAPMAVRDRSGRKKLIVNSMILSLGYYGWACPATFEIENGSQAGGLYLLTAGTTMILPIVLTRNRDVSEASATLAWFGATRGIVHGAMLGLLLSNGDEDGRQVLTASWVTSMAEGVIGYAIADRTRMTAGHAEMIGAGGDAGILIGTAAIGVTQAKGNGGAGLVLAGGGLGLASGHRLAADGRFTTGDAYLFRGAGTLGALLGVTVFSALDPNRNEGRIGSACAMAGGIAGLAYGTHLARKTSLTGSEGVMMNVGMLGGGLLGVGIMVLANPSDDSGLPYLLAASAGATAGFAITYHYIAPGSEETSDTGPWQIDLLPGLAESGGAAGERSLAHRATLSLRLSRRL